MADDPKPPTQEEQADEFRETLQNAYSFVEGQKVAQSFSALTPEDCLDRFIERVEGPGTLTRPNVIDRITRVKSEVLATIEKVKAMPPEAFRKPDPNTDTNTPK